MRICAAVWPFMFAVFPFCNILLKHHKTATFWTIALIGNVVGSGVSMNFSKESLA